MLVQNASLVDPEGAFDERGGGSGNDNHQKADSGVKNCFSARAHFLRVAGGKKYLERSDKHHNGNDGDGNGEERVYDFRGDASEVRASKGIGELHDSAAGQLTAARQLAARWRWRRRRRRWWWAALTVAVRIRGAGVDVWTGGSAGAGAIALAVGGATFVLGRGNGDKTKTPDTNKHTNKHGERNKEKNFSVFRSHMADNLRRSARPRRSPQYSKSD